MSKVKQITENNVNEVIQSKIGVLQFSADWCGPCKMLTPVMESLSTDEQNSGVTIGKVNVDGNQKLAQKYGVRGIPTVIFFKDGKEVNGSKFVGFKSKEELQKMINEL